MNAKNVKRQKLVCKIKKHNKIIIICLKQTLTHKILNIITEDSIRTKKKIKLSRKNCSFQDDKIKLIDFGGATYDDEHHSTVINTR